MHGGLSSTCSGYLYQVSLWCNSVIVSFLAFSSIGKAFFGTHAHHFADRYGYTRRLKQGGSMPGQEELNGTRPVLFLPGIECPFGL